MIDKEIQSALNKMQTQVNLQFKNHTHDATNSFRILPSDLLNSQYYFVLNTVTLKPAQIKLLHNQYQVLIPPPAVLKGTNTVIIVEGITAKINYGGTAYTGANNLEFRYSDASGTKVTADMVNTFINSVTTVYHHVAGVTTELIPVANAQIVVSVPVANPATGNSNITFVIKYRVVTL